MKQACIWNEIANEIVYETRNDIAYLWNEIANEIVYETSLYLE